MTDPVSPTPGPDERRAGRRSTDPAIHAAPAPPPVTSNLPAVTAQPARPEAAAAPFEAQRLGQEGQKRGLRGGPPVLKGAKSAYLGAEYSGKADRRPPKGLFSKAEI